MKLIKSLLPSFENSANAEKSIKNSILEQTNFPSDRTEEKPEI